MDLFTTFIGLCLLASVSLATPQIVTTQTLLPINSAREMEQYQLCKAAVQSESDNGQTFAAVRYGFDGEPFTVKYGQCLPTRDENSNFVASTVFCRSATCTIYKDRNCNGVATPISLVFPTLDGNLSTDTPTVADFPEFLGASASCTPNMVI